MVTLVCSALAFFIVVFTNLFGQMVAGSCSSIVSSSHTAVLSTIILVLVLLTIYVAQDQNTFLRLTLLRKRKPAPPERNRNTLPPRRWLSRANIFRIVYFFNCKFSLAHVEIDIWNSFWLSIWWRKRYVGTEALAYRSESKEMISFKRTINRAEQMLRFEILQTANKILFFSLSL